MGAIDNRADACRRAKRLQKRILVPEASRFLFGQRLFVLAVSGYTDRARRIWILNLSHLCTALGPVHR